MNRLATESSPYLRQHADNPVDWYPWGEEAFDAARQRDRPIFLSVGYSSCHWCHVMAHESFEDPAAAALMNERFVNVKVDREERPDIDAIYMQAVQAMTGRGGWPMSVWLTPDGRPFYGGTYYPPADRPGMPSFTRVGAAIDEAWRNRRSDLLTSADRLTEAIETALPSAPPVPLTPALLDTARAGFHERFDPRHGGFGTAPKFPPAMALMFLARHQARHPDPVTLEMLSTTLDAMASGGMYDQIGGGFARYSVDDLWLIPHFEKMLYDNALLLRAYTHGWLLTGSERYQQVVEETIDYLVGDLRHPDGGFLSAEDADSEGVEGKFYCWSLDELREVCGDDADDAVRFFGVTEESNFVDPHTGFRGNVLRVAERGALRPPTVERARAALARRRAGRVRPGLDDKVLLAWNALAVRALAEAGAAFGRPDWIAEAERTLRFCEVALRRSDGRWLRSWQATTPPIAAYGRARHLAYAEDHAALLEAYLTLAETAGASYLAGAVAVAEALIEGFEDADGGGFFTTGADAETLVVRAKDQQDHATPSANSLAACGLLRLAALTGEHRYEAAARRVVDTVTPFVGRVPQAFPYILDAVERLALGSTEVVIVGAPDHPETVAMRSTLARAVRTATVGIYADPAQGDLGLAILQGRVEPGAPRAYVCRDRVCEMPVESAEALAGALATGG